MAEQARLFEADTRWLVSQRQRFSAVACPACDAGESDPAWEKNELAYLRCRDCATVYMSPRPSPELMAEYYSSSKNYEYWNRVIFPASEDARREKIFRPRAQRLAEAVHRHGIGTGTLVDVGAGFGTFCEEVVALDVFDRVVALEPEPRLAATCRRKGLEVIESAVEDEGLDLAHVDVVTSFEVIEHLFAPRVFLARCATLMKEGGLLLVTAPNVQGFDIVTMGPIAGAVDIEHVNYMHPGSLGRLMASEGFEVVEHQTPGRLDAELVRKSVLAGRFDLDGQPFLRTVLIDRWDEVGDSFQDFLVASQLSSNMWVMARR